MPQMYWIIPVGSGRGPRIWSPGGGQGGNRPITPCPAFPACRTRAAGRPTEYPDNDAAAYSARAA